MNMIYMIIYVTKLPNNV